MSLDVYLTRVQPTVVFEAKGTHNLVDMANEAGIYNAIWRPEEISITKAEQLIEPLTHGITLMKTDPERFKKHNPPNGWGRYEKRILRRAKSILTRMCRCRYDEMNACACQELAVDSCIYCGEPLCLGCFEQGSGFCSTRCAATEHEAVKEDEAVNDRQEARRP